MSEQTKQNTRPDAQQIAEQLDSEEFYELMQAYRHAPLKSQTLTIEAFDAVKAFIVCAFSQATATAEALVLAQMNAHAWTQGVRPAIDATNADEFVSQVIRAIRAEQLTEARRERDAAVSELEHRGIWPRQRAQPVAQTEPCRHVYLQGGVFCLLCGGRQRRKGWREAVRPVFDPPLDPGIVDTVTALVTANVETFESCEGGIGHAYPEPTVRFHGGRAEGMRALSVALRAELPVRELRRVWPVIDGEATGPWWELTFVAQTEAPRP